MHKVSLPGEREGDHQKKYLLNLLQPYQHHGQSPPTLFADCTTAATKNEIHNILMNILKDNVIRHFRNANTKAKNGSLTC